MKFSEFLLEATTANPFDPKTDAKVAAAIVKDIAKKNGFKSKFNKTGDAATGTTGYFVELSGKQLKLNIFDLHSDPNVLHGKPPVPPVKKVMLEFQKYLKKLDKKYEINFIGKRDGINVDNFPDHFEENPINLHLLVLLLIKK